MCCVPLNCVGVWFDSVLLTAGRHHAAPSGSPQAGTSAGQPKTSKRTLLSWLMLLLEATLMTDSQAGTVPAEC